MLSVQNITIKYGECAVLQDVSFDLANGKTVAVLGANGAGKTTLLRALNGALPLAKGEIFLDGASLKNYSRREIARRISVVAQETETKFPVTVLEFVLSGRFAHGGVFGWENERDLAAARTALEMCDLRNYEARFLNRLSGGERQRVVFARAIATEANVLLLDEPTANLDLSHQAMMFRLVRERCETCRASAIVITHDLNLASEFADEIVLLKNGKIFAKGAPAEVLTEENLREVFNVKVLLDRNPSSGKTRVTTLFN
jgi:iron complex transport system ATP-binding protein